MTCCGALQLKRAAKSGVPAECLAEITRKTEKDEAGAVVYQAKRSQLQLEQLQPLVLEPELPALGDERPGALPALPVAMSLG